MLLKYPVLSRLNADRAPQLKRSVMLLMNLFDEINTHKYLYLDKLSEEKDLELCVVVDEAKILGGEPQTIGNATAYGSIVSDETCNKYRIRFKNYVAYSVTNETVAGANAEAQFAGRLFRIYSKSQFLDYIASSTNGVVDTFGPYKHYEIVTLNQIIAVAATHQPEIEIIGPIGAT